MKLSLITTSFLAFALNSSVTQAQMMGLDFYNITNKASVDIASQLGAQVRDKDQALNDFSQTIASDEVLFTFTNDVSSGYSSNIAEIYFDDGTIFSQVSILNDLGGTTNYSGGMKPKDLPGGGNGNGKNIDTSNVDPVFDATAGFGADTGNESDGINASNDILGIVIKLQADLGFNHLQVALANGELRLGLHVISIDNGLSDSFVNNPFALASAVNPVPLPAAAWLFGPALLVAARKRRKA